MINLTEHGMARMNQRGITREMIEIVLEYGDYIQDKVVLNSKKLKKLVQKVSGNLKSKLLKILDKGGLVLVLSDDNALITTYNHNKKPFHKRVKNV